jgi:hypothetical protein
MVGCWRIVARVIARKDADSPWIERARGEPAVRRFTHSPAYIVRRSLVKAVPI